MPLIALRLKCLGQPAKQHNGRPEYHDPTPDISWAPLPCCLEIASSKTPSSLVDQSFGEKALILLFHLLIGMVAGQDFHPFL
jgi:hypothetical protein